MLALLCYKMNFYPILPLWIISLLLLLSAGVGYWSYRHRNPAVAQWQHLLLLILRVLTLLFVTSMLLCPGHMTEERNVKKSHIVFLMDQSASMAVKDLPARQSRLEQASEFLRANRFKSLKDYPVAYYSFNAQTRRHVSPDTLSELKSEGGTDIKQAVAQLDKDVGLNSTAAIVLLSDGLDYSDFKGSEISVPVLSVQIGTEMNEVKDLGIEPFKCPDKISEGEELMLEIPVMLQGYQREKQADFEVFVDNVQVHSAALNLSSGRLHTEKVRIVLATTGIHLIRINTQVFPDEVSHSNNQREIVVEVVQAKDEVAVYFPVLNNSFRPLLREFIKEREALFTAVYKVAEGSYRLRGHNMNPVFSNGLPKKAADLKNVTCLILGSHNNDLLSAAEALMLEQYVQKGGTLICLAGTDSFGKIATSSPIERLLPVVTLDDSYRAGVFRVVPDAVVIDAFVDQMREIIAANSSSVDFTLNGINQVKDVKASAKVLLWAVEETRQPLVVWQPYGRGKVVALLSNSFHQWGAAEQREENFGRFWRQLIAFSKNPDEDADLLKVSVSKTELTADERFSVTAIARHPSYESGAISNIQLTVTADLFPVDSDTPVASVALDKKADCYMSELAGLQPGRYVLRVSSQDGEAVLRTRYKLLLVGDILEENSRIRSERENFRRFSSEKNIFDPSEVERLEDSLREAVRKNIVHRERFLIFETPFFFVAVVLLLLTEWFLRRRFNLF